MLQIMLNWGYVLKSIGFKSGATTLLQIAPDLMATGAVVLVKGLPNLEQGTFDAVLIGCNRLRIRKI